ncbi:MAG: hypothetical protein ACLQDY_21795 [Streptosporangiaceae bacterium]
MEGDPERHHRLKGSLGTAAWKGEPLERWQYEVTGGGRIWYLIDDARRTAWIIQPLITATIGKTTYADMRRMEALVRGRDTTSYPQARPGLTRQRHRRRANRIEISSAFDVFGKNLLEHIFDE